MNKPTLVPFDEIVLRLQHNPLDVALRYAPGGKVHGHEYVTFAPHRSDKNLGSFKVTLRGQYAGKFKDFSSGEFGDMLDLIGLSIGTKDPREKVAEARRFLGLEYETEEQRARHREQLEQRAADRARQADQDASRKRQSVKRLWHSSVIDIQGTPVDAYLMGRGIDINALAKKPGALRYCPDCYCSETGSRLPAMIACITNAKGQLISIHRTYLAVSGSSVTKAGLAEAKKCLGQFKGGFIPLNRGASGKPFKAMPAGDQVCISEGIEDGLSLALLKPSWRSLAAIAVDNFDNLKFWQQANIYIGGQNDGDQSAADLAVRRAMNAYAERGHTVKRLLPPKDFKDWNDALRGLPTKQSEGAA